MIDTVKTVKEVWEYVETTHSAKVDCGEIELRPHWTGLAEIDDIRSLMRQVVADHNNAADYQASLTRLTAQRNRYWEQVEVLRGALQDLIRQLPNDERLADFNLDRAEAALATVAEEGEGED